MSKMYLRVALAFLVVASLASTASWAQKQMGSPAETVAVKQAIATYADAMNRHDGHAAAMCFTDDAKYVDAAGITFLGRKAIDEGLTGMFVDRLRTTHWEIAVRSVRFLTPEIVSVDNDWQSMAANRPAHGGVHTWILVKQHGHWLIVNFHNQSNMS